MFINNIIIVTLIINYFTIKFDTGQGIFHSNVLIALGSSEWDRKWMKQVKFFYVLKSLFFE